MAHQYFRIIQVIGVVFIFGIAYSQDGKKLSSKVDISKPSKTNIGSEVKKTTLLYSNETDSLQKHNINEEKPSEYEGKLNSRK